jgi:aspartate/methionine/tyrosine aminotransferase
VWWWGSAACFNVNRAAGMSQLFCNNPCYDEYHVEHARLHAAGMLACVLRDIHVCETCMITISRAPITCCVQVGWVTGPPQLMAPIIKAHQFLVFTVASNLQRAVAHGLDHESSFYL